MNNNDLIRRCDVKAKKVYCLERHEYVVPVAEIDWLPAAPQPMSAVEYEIAKRRWRDWCESKFRNTRGRYASCDDVQCEYADDECANCKLSPEKEVAFIEKWAQGHPERSEEC